MMSTRINQKREPKLADVPESLNFRGVDEGQQLRLNLDIPMHRVFDGFNIAPAFGLSDGIRMAVLCYFRNSLSWEDIITVTFLSGGTGTPKLLQGARLTLNDNDIAVIVNTAEDLWYQGGHISPDIDTVMYLFAGILNTKTWWGIDGDTFVTHEQFRSLGVDTYLAVGDRDRAVELLRGELLKGGMTLSQATRELCSRLSVQASVFPMTDQEYTTMIETEGGIIHFQEYWVRHRGSVAIRKVLRVPDTRPDACTGALEAMEKSDLIIIGPSNPITSISPILECSGMVDLLKKKPVVAVSPFIGDKPVSGPAHDLMVALGFEPTSAGVYAAYADFIDLFIQDIRDPVEVPGAIRCDTLMTTPEIAKGIMDLILTRMPV